MLTLHELMSIDIYIYSYIATVANATLQGSVTLIGKHYLRSSTYMSSQTPTIG